MVQIIGEPEGLLLQVESVIDFGNPILELCCDFWLAISFVFDK
jgi:hypothetical protein